MRKIILAALLLLLCSSVGLGQQSDLKVLYVGESSEAASHIPSYIGSDEGKRHIELKKERSEAYSKFLKQHFDNFKAIEAPDYNVEMSSEYDVTIFDARPPVLKTVKQDGGWEKKIRLPDDFAFPAIMIGEVAPMTIGRFGNDFLLDHL